MLFDQLSSGHHGKMLLDGLPGQLRPWHLGASLLILGFLALVVDYAYMLRMRSKLVSASFSLSFFVFLALLERAANRHAQPPGPLPWPVVGNTFMLPDNKPWIWFEELSKAYDAQLITIWIGR